MATKEQSLTWRKDFCCSCPQEILLYFKDSAFLTPAGKYLRAKLLSQEEAVLEIRYDDATLTDPEAGISTCDLDLICCMTACDLYLESLILAEDEEV